MTTNSSFSLFIQAFLSLRYWSCCSRQLFSSELLSNHTNICADFVNWTSCKSIKFFSFKNCLTAQHQDLSGSKEDMAVCSYACCRDVLRAPFAYVISVSLKPNSLSILFLSKLMSGQEESTESKNFLTVPAKSFPDTNSSTWGRGKTHHSFAMGSAPPLGLRSMILLGGHRP